MKRWIQAGYIMMAILSPQIANAQDIHFSQFYEHGILRNPALTGIFSGDYKIALDYRNQWASIANPYRTYILCAEAKSVVSKETNDYISYGVAASADKAGSVDFTSLQIMPAVSYNKSLGDAHQSYLSVGFAGGYIQRSVDPSKMSFASQYIGGSFSQNNLSGENIEKGTVHYWDLSAGVSFNSSLGERGRTNYYLGAAAYHITEPKLAFGNNSQYVNQSMKWNGQLGVSSYLSQHWGMNAHLAVSVQKPYREIVAGGMARYMNVDPYVAQNNYSVYAGVFYRVGDAIIPAFKLAYMNYMIGLSYDFNTSPLRAVSNGRGGFELTLAMKGFWKQTINRTECPRFEDSYLYMED